MADVEMGHMGPSPTSNPIHGDNVLHRRALGHKRASFSTAHSVTVESSAITVDSWLLANSLPSGDEPWDPVDGVALDRSRGVVRHSVGPGAAVFFIADWKRLWSHLAADPHDTFGDNYPFYRDLVDFLCHFRTMQVAVAVAAYSAVIGALCCVIYIPLSDFVLTLCVLNPLCFCLLYWWAYVCYKGPLVQRERVAPNVLDAYGQAEPGDSGTEGGGANSLSARPAEPPAVPPTEPSCVGLAMRAVRSFAEVAADSLLPCLSLDTEQSLPLLRYQPTTSQLAENLGIYQLLNVAAKFILLRGAGNGSKILYKLIRIYCTLIVLIISTLNVQFIASMFFSLGLRGCWYGEDPEYPERLCAMLSILYPSTLFLVIPCGLTAFMLAAALVLAAGSGFATMMALQLSNSWVNRFGSLRQLDVSSPVDPAETDDKNKAIFANLVSRDATESYLFQQAFMNQLGRKFNFILAAQVLISFVSLALNIVALLLDPNPEKTFVGKDAVVSVAMIMWVNLMYAYPICCIAHSNLAIDRLLDTVKASGMSDFSILGGRHEWIAFVNDNPCFWRILGVPFTYRTLGVAITSTIAPVLYLLLPGRWLALIGGGTEVAS